MAQGGLQGHETILRNLRRQVVSGTNYCLLCEITPVTPNAEATYALVTVYADLNGGAEITATNDFVAAQ